MVAADGRAFASMSRTGPISGDPGAVARPPLCMMAGSSAHVIGPAFALGDDFERDGELPRHHGPDLLRLTGSGRQQLGLPSIEYRLAQRVGFQRGRMGALEALPACSSVMVTWAMVGCADGCPPLWQTCDLRQGAPPEDDSDTRCEDAGQGESGLSACPNVARERHHETQDNGPKCHKHAEVCRP
jgi:hypothetical protein